MIYRIVYEGKDLWKPGENNVLSPTVEVKLNEAGSLSFTFPPGHPDFYTIQPLKGTIEVYENNDLIWFGRAVSLERNIRNEKPVYCEGALTYFADSVQRSRAKANTTAAVLFAAMLAEHNAQVPADRQFTAGTVTMPEDAFTWENSYTDTKSAIKALLEEAGGFLIPRRSGSTNYLDFVADLEKKLNPGQPVEFGLNMKDFHREYSFADKITAVLPVGGVAEGATAATTIASVNDGSDILDGDGVSEYGRIVKTVTYSEITDPAVLKAAAQKYLDSVAFSPISIKAKAADLSFIQSQYFPFRVGYQYFVHSELHDVAEWLPLKRLSINMDSAVREIELESKRDGSGAVLVELVVVYRYLGEELGQKSHFFPAGYEYTITLPYLDVSSETHQYVYRPLVSTLTGTIPEHVVFYKVYADYDVALDLDKEIKILNVISVDSFTAGGSGGLVIGVIA